MLGSSLAVSAWNVIIPITGGTHEKPSTDDHEGRTSAD